MNEQNPDPVKEDGKKKMKKRRGKIVNSQNDHREFNSIKSV